MLQQVDDEEIERPDDPAREARDEHEPDDPSFHPQEQAVEQSQDAGTESSQHG
jgi:hypothetical protein